MTVKETISRKLSAALAPSFLSVEDESHLHSGHVGAKPEGETHFRVVIVSQHFVGLSRVERHRLVSGVLKEELAGPVHALALKTQSPEEHANSQKSSDPTT